MLKGALSVILKPLTSVRLHIYAHVSALVKGKYE